MIFQSKSTVPEENQLLGHSRFADLTPHKSGIFSLFHDNERQEENTLTHHLVKLFVLSSASRKSYLYISYEKAHRDKRLLLGQAKREVLP